MHKVKKVLIERKLEELGLPKNQDMDRSIMMIREVLGCDSDAFSRFD